MKQKFIEAHMKVAETYAELSSARRLHVGAIIVKDDRIISIGYNGMPSGWENDCEYRHYLKSDDLPDPWEYLEEDGTRYTLKTKPEVLHAETNAIAKLAKNGESSNGATMFITHAPCIDCAKLVYQSGINSVFYRNSYRNEDGVHFLEKCGVKVEKC